MSNASTPSVERKCEWCAETMTAQALRCPHCQKWRKDIEGDRVKCWGWSLLGILPCIFLGVGLANNWWAPPPPPGMFWLTTKFSFPAFLTSWSGLLILGGLALTEGLCLKYYIRVSRKIGSWWWF
jgi:hypothetical protein